MKIEFDTTEKSNNRIDSYQKGSIVINGQQYSSSLIVTPIQLITDWGPGNNKDFAPQHFKQIISLKPEIIIIGTGQQCIHPVNDMLLPIIELNIGLEIMDTGAACRCYNLLMSEGRNIAAGILQITD